MTNDEIKILLHETHNVFFKKWRSKSLSPDSDEWDDVVKDACDLLNKYKENERAKIIILWFLDELDLRSKESLGGML